jgi:protocatechuate 3,4-dioxygenase beta subunit
VKKPKLPNNPMKASSLILPSGLDRRRFLNRAALGLALFAVPGAFAAALQQTPKVGFGPFYPDHLPLDTDNDLILINDALTPAVGEISYVSGRVLGPDGEPIRNAIVEIWEADRNGIYIHSGGGDKEKADKNFQGYGRFLTGESGEYLFRTIKPVAYRGRCPHIHCAVKIPGRDKWSTELHIKDHPLNADDGVRRGVKNPELLEVEFKPVAGSKVGELAGKFDLVMGLTPVL